MSKLLNSGICRYIRSYVFWIGVIATTELGLLAGYWARNYNFDDSFIMTQFFIFAVVVSWLIGRESDQGVIKNKIIVGHTKGSIFLSELILAIGTCTVMFLIFAAAFALYNGYVFEVLSLSTIAKIFVGFLLLNISMMTIMVVVTCLISRTAISGIANLLIIFVMATVGYELDGMLKQPQYYIVTEMQEELHYDENGNPYWTETSVEGTERKEVNPEYLKGAQRELCQVAQSVMPFGQITGYMDFLKYYLGYVYYRDATGEYVEGLAQGMPEELMEQVPEWAESYRAAEKNIDIYPMHSLVLILMASGLGYYFLRKKEIK